MILFPFGLVGMWFASYKGITQYGDHHDEQEKRGVHQMQVDH